VVVPSTDSDERLLADPVLLSRIQSVNRVFAPTPTVGMHQA
jgi:hypothetical protein